MATSQSITEADVEKFRQMPLPTGPLFVNETGNVYGGKVVVCYGGQRGRGVAYWVCRCKCGLLHVVRGGDLRKGDSRHCNHCGSGKTHGGSRSPEYRAWHGMIQRCVNRKLPCWKRYGGRGICTCIGFRTFANFISVAGKKPTPKHEIDRRNNDGHYSCGHCEECLANGWPMNVRWVTRRQNSVNRGNNHLIEFRGAVKPMTVWAEEMGMRPSVVLGRIRNGWSIERALTVPPKKVKRQPALSCIQGSLFS